MRRHRPGGQLALDGLVAVLCDAKQPIRARMFAAAALQNLASDIVDAPADGSGVEAGGYKAYDGAKVCCQG